MPHISTGEILRSLEGESGETIHQQIDRGRFAPDDFMLNLVRQRLSQYDCEIGFILDGFPRTLAQAVAFDPMMQEFGWQLDHVFSLLVADEVLINRIRTRNRVENRIDDSEQWIGQRFQLYRDTTLPVLDFYTDQGLVRSVNGDAEVDQVHRAIVNWIR